MVGCFTCCDGVFVLWSVFANGVVSESEVGIEGFLVAVVKKI